MASIGKDNDLRSFDVPEISRHAGGYTIYKIVLQVTPKELTENSYQVRMCLIGIFIVKFLGCLLETLF
jgi:hypothetical protein